MDQKFILVVLCSIALAPAAKSAESTDPSEITRLNASDSKQWRIMVPVFTTRSRTTARKGFPSMSTVKRNGQITLNNNGQGTRKMTTVQKGKRPFRTSTTVKRVPQTPRIPLDGISGKLKNAPTNRPMLRASTTTRRTSTAGRAPLVAPFSLFGIQLYSAIPFAPSETSTTEDPIGVYPDEEGSFNSTWPEYAYGEETEFTLSDYIYGLIPENTTTTDAGIVVTEAITTNTAMSTNITTTVNPKMVRKRRKKTTTATTTVSTPRSGVAIIRVKRKRTTVAPIVVA
uniref:Uncharacterized protein n=1 Tax=Anopheles atroparvus TaxID=41427 RepID=A0AAG5CZ80_ANOAO